MGIIAGMLIILVLVLLAYASRSDYKYRIMPDIVVIALFIIAPIYIYASGADFVTASFCFMFTLFTFLLFFVIGGLGFGDVLVLAALGWMIADFTILRVFLLTLGVMSIPWAMLWLFVYHRNPDYKVRLGGFHKVVKTKDLKPGMNIVGCNTKLVRGASQSDIDEIKKNGDHWVWVKEGMPYAPLIFAATAACQILAYFSISF